MDRCPPEDASDYDRSKSLSVYRKITALRSVTCCGMCGTTRFQTKPYWCLGMRLCRQCLRMNLVSSSALYERYWITFGQPVDGYPSFVDAVCSNVFYFRTVVSSGQRLEFSYDEIDFPGGVRTIWFFWRPHLEAILNMPRLEREGREKDRASSVLRGFMRRTLVLRTLANARLPSEGTPILSHAFRKKDLRTMEFKLKKIQLLGCVDRSNFERSRARLSPERQRRLLQWEDRVAPFLFN